MVEGKNLFTFGIRLWSYPGSRSWRRVWRVKGICSGSFV